MASALPTLRDLERLVEPGTPDPPHVVAPIVHDLWLAIGAACLHPTQGNRDRLTAAAEKASAHAEERLPGKGVSVDALLRWAERYADAWNDVYRPGA